jgi:hypothetical protein
MTAFARSRVDRNDSPAYLAAPWKQPSPLGGIKGRSPSSRLIPPHLAAAVTLFCSTSRTRRRCLRLFLSSPDDKGVRGRRDRQFFLVSGLRVRRMRGCSWRSSRGRKPLSETILIAAKNRLPTFLCLDHRRSKRFSIVRVGFASMQARVRRVRPSRARGQAARAAAAGD